MAYTIGAISRSAGVIIQDGVETYASALARDPWLHTSSALLLRTGGAVPHACRAATAGATHHRKPAVFLNLHIHSTGGEPVERPVMQG